MVQFCSFTVDFFSIGCPWRHRSLNIKGNRLIPTGLFVLHYAAVSLANQYYTTSSRQKYSDKGSWGLCVCARARVTDWGSVWERTPCSWFGCVSNSYQDESCLNRFLSSLFALRFTCACKWCWLRVIWLFNCWTAATLTADCHCRLSQ